MLQLQDIPKGYALCFADKTTCPKAESCLRAIAAQALSQSPHPEGIIQTVNLHYIRSLVSPDQCEYYRDSHPVRFAIGMTHLFDELPLKVATQVRRNVMACFSCESYFYSSRKGTRPITPEEQQHIRHVFGKAGIKTEPQFDRYMDKENW